MKDHDRPHHHGNLRQALIEAGLALLAEGGRAGLTLRRTAARAGVSHAAPAHHFDGLPGLLTAIAAQAFARFTAAMTEAREAAGPDEFARLNGICAGYLSFAASHAGLFDLMFNDPDIKRDDPEMAPHAQAAYMVLRDACQPFASPSRPDREMETAVWSLVHGYALLRFGRQTHDERRPFAKPPEFARLLRNLVLPPA